MPNLDNLKKQATQYLRWHRGPASKSGPVRPTACSKICPLFVFTGSDSLRVQLLVMARHFFESKKRAKF
jgi:hypothetical protein